MAQLPSNAGGEAEEDPDWVDEDDVADDPEQGMGDALDYDTDDDLHEDRDLNEYPDGDPTSAIAKKRKAAMARLYKKANMGGVKPTTGVNLGKLRWVEVLFAPNKDDDDVAVTGKRAAKAALPNAPATKRQKKN